MKFILLQSVFGCLQLTTRKESSQLTDQEWGVYHSTIQKAIEIGVWNDAAVFHDQLSPETHNHGIIH